MTGVIIAVTEDAKEASGAASVKHYLLYKAVKTDLEEEVVFDDSF